MNAINNGGAHETWLKQPFKGLNTILLILLYIWSNKYTMGCNNFECQFFFKWVALLACKVSTTKLSCKSMTFQEFLCMFIGVKRLEWTFFKITNIIFAYQMYAIHSQY